MLRAEPLVPGARVEILCRVYDSVLNLGTGTGAPWRRRETRSKPPPFSPLPSCPHPQTSSIFFSLSKSRISVRIAGVLTAFALIRATCPNGVRATETIFPLPPG